MPKRRSWVCGVAQGITKAGCGGSVLCRARIPKRNLTGPTSRYANSREGLRRVIVLPLFHWRAFHIHIEHRLARLALEERRIVLLQWANRAAAVLTLQFRHATAWNKEFLRTIITARFPRLFDMPIRSVVDRVIRHRQSSLPPSGARRPLPESRPVARVAG